jgi:HTH-type transcriptional regulator / antitoxin HipB
MIKNDKQYSVTKKQLHMLEIAIKQLKAIEKEIPDDVFDIRLRALESQREELVEDLSVYTSLKDGNLCCIQLTSLEDIYIALIQARIAGNLTQKELADKLGLKEQQIQRYEATNYTTASLPRIKAIADCLGIKFWFEKIIFFRTKFDLPNTITKKELENEQNKIINRGHLFPIC